MFKALWDGRAKLGAAVTVVFLGCFTRGLCGRHWHLRRVGREEENPTV